MFRNQYDSDVTVWSPQGRLHQVEYAMEAVKLGTATVGLKTNLTLFLLLYANLYPSYLLRSEKIIPIDDHLGISIAGITADARVLSKWLRSECLNYKHSYESIYPISRLITNLGNKMQTTTQRYDRRPFGVGLLVAGYDENGPHIYQVVPSANYINCKAMSIGSRSQSARTYLERHLSSFNDCTTDEIICHGINAIRGSLSNDELITKTENLSQLNITIAIVGENYNKFTILTDEETNKYLEMANNSNSLDDQRKPTEVVGTSGSDDDPKPGPSDSDPQVAVGTME